MGVGEPAPCRPASFRGIHTGPPGPEPPEVTMWNAEFELGTIRPNLPETGVRPEPEPLPPKANLEAIASILAAGVLRRRARKGDSSRDVGRKAENT